MDGLDLVSMVCDIMHHLKKKSTSSKRSVWIWDYDHSDGILCYIITVLYLVVHHSIRHLSHLTQNSQRVREAVFGPGLRLIPAELALQGKQKSPVRQKSELELASTTRLTSSAYLPGPASPSAAWPWPS